MCELRTFHGQVYVGEQKPLSAKSNPAEINLWAILKSNYEHKKDDTSDDIKAVFTSLMKIYAHMLGKNASKAIVHDADLRAKKYRILNQLINGISDILISDESNELKDSKYKRVMEQFDAIEENGGLSILDMHSSEGMMLLRKLVNIILCPILLFIPLIFPGFRELLAPKSAVLFYQAKNTLTQTSEIQFNAQFQDQLEAGQHIEAFPTK